MARRQALVQVQEVWSADSAYARISNFLLRELPPRSAKQKAYVTDALLAAGARYDRYAARKDEWGDYKVRRGRLKKISSSMDDLARCMHELDILSLDDLASRVDEKAIEALVGSLHRLSKVTSDLAAEVQPDGRPRDLAYELWILELADIYRNFFGRPAKVSGSGGGESKHRGSFYRLLEVSQPASLPRYGKLSVRQVDRVLKRPKHVKRR